MSWQVFVPKVILDQYLNDPTMKPHIENYGLFLKHINDDSHISTLFGTIDSLQKEILYLQKKIVAQGELAAALLSSFENGDKP